MSRGGTGRGAGRPGGLPGPIDHLSALWRPYLDAKVLMKGGYLQEVNRRFFHPLGLHMTLELAGMMSGEVGDLEPDHPFHIRVLDCRDAEAGVVYAPVGDASDARCRSRRESRIEAEWKRRAAIRRQRTGSVRQPVQESVAD